MTPIRRDDEDDIDPAIISAVRKAAREAQMEIPNYSEGNQTFLKWVLTLCGGLALIGVTGGIVMYGKLSMVETTVNERTTSIQRQMDENKREFQAQLDELKRSVDRTRP